MLNAHGEYALPVNVPANQFLNFEGDKFSKSKNWGIEQHEKETFFLQWGDNPGIKHFAVCSSTKRVGVVVLTNGQNGQHVSRPVVEKILGSKLDAFENI